MKALKTIFDLVVLGYIVFTVLLLTTILNENTIFNISSEEQVLLLYKILGAVGACIMLARLLVNNMYIASLKHDQYRANLKINGLKADLYEKRQEFRYTRPRQAKAQEAEVSN
ncbi:hypothetical protein [Pontibacter harenae]|uniref:hypothetical protein n=1 Tax=Pontibacter harenae TaxID=2894083 RepID=UPI001E2C93E1|nr:hypothetical protein [Pontibacter harenae]MCC9168356.1 hypothetical protein [Pontibacter harenae]